MSAVTPQPHQPQQKDEDIQVPDPEDELMEDPEWGPQLKKAVEQIRSGTDHTRPWREYRAEKEAAS